jgi:site-specific DNA-cytosine methylase
MPSNDEAEKTAREREIKRAYMRSWETKNREARKAYARAYYAKNKEARLAKGRERVEAWHKENPEAVLEHKRRYREKNREKLREYNRNYIRDETGELSDKYKEGHKRKIAQKAVDRETMAGRPRPEICDACGGPPDKNIGMHFDHCHTHGHFRGWICRECNLALGNVRDDPQRLLKLVAYLKRTARKPADQLAIPGV